MSNSSKPRRLVVPCYSPLYSKNLLFACVVESNDLQLANGEAFKAAKELCMDSGSEPSDIIFKEDDDDFHVFERLTDWDIIRSSFFIDIAKNKTDLEQVANTIKSALREWEAVYLSYHCTHWVNTERVMKCMYSKSKSFIDIIILSSNKSKIRFRDGDRFKMISLHDGVRNKIEFN